VSALARDLERDGFSIVKDVIAPHETSALIEAVDSADFTRSTRGDDPTRIGPSLGIRI